MKPKKKEVRWEDAAFRNGGVDDDDSKLDRFLTTRTRRRLRCLSLPIKAKCRAGTIYKVMLFSAPAHGTTSTCSSQTWRKCRFQGTLTFNGTQITSCWDQKLMIQLDKLSHKASKTSNERIGRPYCNEGQI